MRLRPSRHAAPKPAPSLKRTFVTPEGVDLRLELGGAGQRAVAFLLDGAIILGLLIAMTLGVLLILPFAMRSSFVQILWLLGFFVLREGWFILFEMGPRAATPGKRALGLRVVARDGGRLTGGAVVARNAMREIEVFLPLSFLAARTGEGSADALVVISSLLWSGIFLFFPLFNRDRLRVGDLLAGTWVVQTARARLGSDLAESAVAHGRRNFGEAALALYGVYELQTLEDVLRRDQDDAIVSVAGTIRRKAGIPDDGDDRGFLTDYYAALCGRLERDLLLGRRRADKHARADTGSVR